MMCFPKLWKAHFEKDKKFLKAKKAYKKNSLGVHQTNIPPGFPGRSVVKSPPANAGDVGSILGLGRSPGRENENPLQYPRLENLMDRGAWRATIYGVTELGTTE